MKKRNIGDITIFYRDEKYLEILDKLEFLDIEKVFKDDQRSKVSVFDFNGEKLVFKVPREKNKRKWQRFLSIFRGSESYREYLQNEKIKKSGFKTFDGMLVFEKREYGFVVDSFFICEYLRGKTGSLEELEKIKKSLGDIHKKGYLHGDSQLVNFIIDSNDVYIIDSKLRKNIYGKFGESYEFIYLEESCGRLIDYDKDSIYYKVAKLLNNFLHFKGNLKNKIKKKNNKYVHKQ